MQGLWASLHLCILSTFPSLDQWFVFTAVFNLESKVAAPKKKKKKSKRCLFRNGISADNTNIIVIMFYLVMEKLSTKQICQQAPKWPCSP